MKRHKWFGWTLAAIMTGASFTACTNETEEVFAQQSNEIKLTSAITPESRANDTGLQSDKIETGQQVGVTITGAKSDHKNIAWKAESDGSLTNLGNTLYWGTGDVNITAYHPYNSQWTGTEHTFSVQTDQYNNGNNNNYLNSDLLWVKKTVQKTTEPIKLLFEHKLSKIIIYVTAESYSNVSICGTITSAKFDLSTGNVTPQATTPSDIKVSVDGNSAAAIIIPQTVNANTKFIKVENNGKTYYYTLSTDKTFEPGKAYTYTLALVEKEEGTELVLISPESGNITDWNTTDNYINGNAYEFQDITGDVIIENPGLSQALLYKLGSDKVAINLSGYAVMSQADADAVTRLDLMGYSDNNSPIETLNDIYKLKNIEHIDLDVRASLKDCSDLSKVTGLRLFRVHNSQIESMDFSRNTELEGLYINYNRKLSSLNLTNCTSLDNLQIFDNELTTTSLTIPQNVKNSVTNLLYSGTDLVLNLNEYPNLWGLGCESMNLTDETLDDLIPDQLKSKLGQLLCANNQLTKLDLSKYPNLTILQCDNNKIAELKKLSSLTELENFSCQHNRLTSLDISSHIKLINQWRCGGQTDQNNTAITINLTVSAAQKAAYEDTSNGLQSWGNNNINLIVK